MLKSPKLQKRASDPEWPKMGVSQTCKPQFIWIWGQLPMGPKWEVQKETPMWAS